jgi:hypothetical protein
LFEDRVGTLLWHKHYHERFLEGVVKLNATEIGTYIVIIEMLYARVPHRATGVAGVQGRRERAGCPAGNICVPRCQQRRDACLAARVHPARQAACCGLAQR